jgi:hypothetical protein
MAQISANFKSHFQSGCLHDGASKLLIHLGCFYARLGLFVIRKALQNAIVKQ